MDSSTLHKLWTFTREPGTDDGTVEGHSALWLDQFQQYDFQCRDGLKEFRRVFYIFLWLSV